MNQGKEMMELILRIWGNCLFRIEGMLLVINIRKIKFSSFNKEIRNFLPIPNKIMINPIILLTIIMV
jgi:hypothetical protein